MFMVNQLREIDYQHRELYSRIQAFSLDQPNTQLSFSRRLARDNGWSTDHTRRVIEEYKKFVFGLFDNSSLLRSIAWKTE